MAQPPDYGSYVKRETKEFKILKFINFALLVTLIFGAIEAFIIYFVMNNGKEKKQTTLIKKRVIPVKIITPDIDTSQQISTDSTLIKQVAPPIIIDTPKPAISVKKDSVVLKPIVAKPIAVVKPIVVVKDTIKAIRDTSKVKPVEKELTQLKMQSILENVRKQKIKFNITSNCIQIRKTSSSNVKNAFKIAEYLKKNGFIIGGRLTVDGNVQGVKVKMDANCIELTIGTL